LRARLQNKSGKKEEVKREKLSGASARERGWFCITAWEHTIYSKLREYPVVFPGKLEVAII